MGTGSRLFSNQADEGKHENVQIVTREWLKKTLIMTTDVGQRLLLSCRDTPVSFTNISRKNLKKKRNYKIATAFAFFFLSFAGSYPGQVIEMQSR